LACRPGASAGNTITAARASIRERDSVSALV
jgi:hypothetical protein